MYTAYPKVNVNDEGQFNAALQHMKEGAPAVTFDDHFDVDCGVEADCLTDPHAGEGWKGLIHRYNSATEGGRLTRWKSRSQCVSKEFKIDYDETVTDDGLKAMMCGHDLPYW